MTPKDPKEPTSTGSPASFLTTDAEELMKRWMKLYLNLMSLKCHFPPTKAILDKYQQKFAETNEYMMEFFDALGA